MVLPALEGYVQTRYAQRLRAKKNYEEATAVLDKAERSSQRVQQVAAKAVCPQSHGMLDPPLKSRFSAMPAACSCTTVP